MVKRLGPDHLFIATGPVVAFWIGGDFFCLPLRPCC